MSLANAVIQNAVAPNTAAVSVVLLVEDEPAIRKLASRILQRRGFMVLEAGGGEDALRVAADYAGVIDVLLTDLSMPGIDGAEVARELARTQPAMQVIFMSGYGQEDLGGYGVRGTARFLGKPFTPDGLVAKVTEALA